jgi:2'-5' RNA ligase
MATAHYQSWSLDDYIRRLHDADTISAIDAYESVAWFGAAIDVRRNAFTNTPFDLMRGDQVVGDNLSAEELDPEFNIFYVLDDMFTDLDLFGAAYCYFETNDFGLNARWRRFHPRSVIPRHNSKGKLTHFVRVGDGTSTRIELNDPNFIWLWMPSYRRENHPGVGVGHRGLLAASSLLNKDKFQNAFFENGAISPTLVRIKGYGQLDEDEQERTQNIFRQMWGGIRNAFKIHPIDGDEVDVVPMMQRLKDMSMEELTKSQREEVSTGLGVPQNILLGNAANFATARADNFNLYDKWVVPMAEHIIAAQLNERYYVARGRKLVYRKERLDVFQDAMLDKSSALVPWYDKGVLTTNEIRPLIGFQVIERPEADEFVVPERLKAPNGASSDTTDSQVDQIESLEGLDAKAHFVGNEAYVTIDLANHPQLAGVQQRLMDELSGGRDDSILVGDWQEPETFHITLVYCYDIDNRKLNNATETFRFHGFDGFDIRALGLSVFNNPEGQALHLAIQHTPLLDALQKRVWAEFSDVNTSEFSKPAMWQPHITMAYLPLGMPIPQIEFTPFDLAVEKIQFMRDDYMVFDEFQANEALPDPLDFELDDDVKQALDDLDKWERMALKRLKEGSPEKTVDFESEYIAPIQHSALVGMLSSVKDADHVKALFGEAKTSASEWVNYG